ncbi:MAG TPA: LPXTG cell wall anchor domain-containing protein [Pilimelia sp.]|nr:LPXTG cell wall anchor domain-containing protein [Pilimelia sp.]
MSHSKTLGPSVAVAAALPVTGSNTILMFVVGVGVLVTGLLLMRLARVRADRS